MKKSRLKLFKSTSMTISILGIIMILLTVIVFAYMGFSMISSGVTNTLDGGTAQDQLSILENNYTQLSGEYETRKKTIYASGDMDLKEKYVNAELELVKAKSAITDFKSAIDSQKSDSEIKSRYEAAKSQMKIAKNALNEIS